ncbi:hypothetical protein [Aquabacterium humicola]|nr:hypothetical protein [Rubrivivax pictus]
MNVPWPSILPASQIVPPSGAEVDDASIVMVAAKAAAGATH